MCLLILDKNVKPTKLTEELLVYKMLKSSMYSNSNSKYLKSMVYYSLYVQGRLYRTEFTFNNDFRWADITVRDLMLKQSEEISKWFQPPPIKKNATMVETFYRRRQRNEALRDRDVLFSVNAGFHACETFERAKIYDHNQRVEGYGLGANLYSCYIPAGAEVYRDATGLITSNQIIIGDKITEQ